MGRGMFFNLSASVNNWFSLHLTFLRFWLAVQITFHLFFKGYPNVLNIGVYLKLFTLNKYFRLMNIIPSEKYIHAVFFP